MITNEFEVNKKTREEFGKRIITNMFDVIIIIHFEQETFSGYDVTKFFHKQLEVIISPGTIYAHLYAMERASLLTSYDRLNKRVFKATKKGLQLAELVSSKEKIAAFMAKITKK
jgi:DNA-binding PadR family transcriptional regulator